MGYSGMMEMTFGYDSVDEFGPKNIYFKERT